jgi:GTP cyclohydrolase IA
MATKDYSNTPIPDSTPAENSQLPHIFNGVDAKTRLQIAGQLMISAAKTENASRQGLLKTPERFSKAMTYLLSGYDSTPEKIAGEGLFPAEGRGLVSVNNAEFYSLCEHHMLPFWGNVSVAYYPSEKIIGLSKIPRVIDLFARRLQVQERMTQNIADALFALVKPRAIVVRISGQHLCMMMRGVEKQNSFTRSESSIGLEILTNLEQQRLFSALEER